ncbi:MAG: CopD family protein [Flavobacteriales bacterium]|nr:CopD family protein [Flavobacteriales bacterium]
MGILHFKALHLIFMVTWFAGLFYIVRLFVYHREASDKEEPEKSILIKQFKLMQKRLWYGITWPSAILIFVFALPMLYLNPLYLSLPFMHLKLALVFGLFLYHLYCHRIFRQFQNDNLSLTSFKLRVWNEVATLFLVAIIFVVSLKNLIDWMWGLLGIVLFSLFLLLAIRIYKSIRLKNKD